MEGEPLALKELNKLIKSYVDTLNGAIDLHIKIEDTRDRIRWLEYEEQAHRDHLDEVITEKEKASMMYNELLQHPVQLEAQLHSTYTELSKKWPRVEPSAWHIPDVFPAVFTAGPKLGFRHSAFAKRIVAGYSHGYRKTTMRYVYAPKLSKRSAIVKIEDLKLAVAQMWPSERALAQQLDDFLMKEGKLREMIEILKERVEQEESSCNLSGKYFEYCDAARKAFAKIKYLQTSQTISTNPACTDNGSDTLPMPSPPSGRKLLVRVRSRGSSRRDNMDAFSPSGESFGPLYAGPTRAESKNIEPLFPANMRQEVNSAFTSNAGGTVILHDDSSIYFSREPHGASTPRTSPSTAKAFLQRSVALKTTDCRNAESIS